eukprot:PhM_4_TR8439/c1_g1_i3/m.3976
MQVAETFFLPTGIKEDPDITLEKLGLKLASCVTVVDASAFHDNMSGKCGPLLAQQIEFANVVIVNKTDLVTDADTICEAVRRMNPHARVERSAHAQLEDLPRLLEEKLFSVKDAERQSDWLQSLDLYNAGDVGETVIYDISSVVYRNQRPFHPERLHKFLFTDLNTPELVAKYGRVLRMKGYVWIGNTSKYAYRGNLNMAGSVVTVESVDELTEDDVREVLEHGTLDGVGYDRFQELVIIGHTKGIKRYGEHLDGLLMTDAELGGLKDELGKHDADHPVPSSDALFGEWLYEGDDEEAEEEEEGEEEDEAPASKQTK